MSKPNPAGAPAQTTANPADHQTTPPEQDPVERAKAWRGLWVLAIALAMIVLDGTIVSVSLPVIIADLHLNLTDAQWVTSLYSVVFAALLLPAGRFGDRWGRRRMLLAGVSIFMLGSILAALSGTTAMLLLARAIQGVGGSMVLPATLSTVNATFRGRDRAAAFGVWGAVMSGAAALGPLLGGALTEYGSWQLIFWVNVPIGIGVLYAATRFVTETHSGEDTGQRPDLLGPVLSALGFGLLVFAFIEASSLGWWAPTGPFAIFGFDWPATAPISVVPLALALGALCLAGFVTVEHRRRGRNRSTILNLRLFRIPTFTLGNLTATLVAVGEFSLLFVLPLYLVNSLGLNTLEAGAVLAAMATGAFVSGGAARHLAAAMGASRVVMVGLGLEVLGAAGTATVMATTSSAWAVAATLLPYGLGLGLAAAQLTSTVLRDVPLAYSGAGSATQSTGRQIGSALGSAVGGSTLAGALNAQAIHGLATGAQFATAAALAICAAVAVLAMGLLSAWQLHRRASLTHG